MGCLIKSRCMPPKRTNDYAVVRQYLADQSAEETARFAEILPHGRARFTQKDYHTWFGAVDMPTSMPKRPMVATASECRRGQLEEAARAR